MTEAVPEMTPAVALVGARFRENMTRRQLARVSGVSVRRLSVLEGGASPPTKEEAYALALALLISVDRLLG